MESTESTKSSMFAMALFGICIMDLISTGFVLRLGGREFNPIMNFVLKYGGIWLMAAVKIFTVALGVILLETARSRDIISPRRHRNYYLAAILLYLGIYAVFFVIANFLVSQ